MKFCFPGREVWRSTLGVFLALICLTLAHAVSVPQALSAQTGPALQIDKASIGGTVVNADTSKPEAGVWVIAETKLAVPFRKIVVTDDQGRFLVPDLPAGSYELWVRGYGLKDSEKSRAERGADYWNV